MRLVERANQVLAERVVDTDLPANRAVHLGEERGRHVHQRDAAQVARRRETGQIANDAAAERNERRRTIRVGTDERVVDPRHGRELFEPFAVGNDDRLGISGSGKPLAVETPDQRARHDEAAPRRPGFVEQAREPVEEAVAK